MTRAKAVALRIGAGLVLAPVLIPVQIIWAMGWAFCMVVFVFWAAYLIARHGPEASEREIMLTWQTRPRLFFWWGT